MVQNVANCPLHISSPAQTTLPLETLLKCQLPEYFEISFPPYDLRASLTLQLVKNLPAVRETWVRSLGWEDPLEKGKATHSSILARRIPWAV